MVSDLIHMPCPTMAGMENPSRERRENSLNIVRNLREKYGFQPKQKKQPKPLTYVCTDSQCLESWEK